MNNLGLIAWLKTCIEDMPDREMEFPNWWFEEPDEYEEGGVMIGDAFDGECSTCGQAYLLDDLKNALLAVDRLHESIRELEEARKNKEAE
ncbi:MAG TPA: hypothetical protein ENH62_08090 [Marinobacter sp.]|uniref:Uncharacterized protein n=1 Tax=marine sediment metagenome TaxID=412755 RepID=A0A0F9CJ02_9ZZZZ|nr:hypothetical protein [Marinobacter sp.]